PALPEQVKLPEPLEPKGGQAPGSLLRQRFRTARTPVSVSGSIWVDAQTAVILQAKVDGRLRVPGEEGQPTTELSVSVRSALSDIGKEPTIEVPEDFLPDADKPEGIAEVITRYGFSVGAAAENGGEAERDSAPASEGRVGAEVDHRAIGCVRTPGPQAGTGASTRTPSPSGAGAQRALRGAPGVVPMDLGGAARRHGDWPDPGGKEDAPGGWGAAVGPTPRSIPGAAGAPPHPCLTPLRPKTGPRSDFDRIVGASRRSPRGSQKIDRPPEGPQNGWRSGFSDSHMPACSVPREVGRMERKSSSSTAVVTSREVRTALTKQSARLTTQEEQTLRMRHGAGVDGLDAPLARAAGDNEEVADELLLLEMSLLRGARAAGKAPKGLAAPENSAKQRILEALGNKKR